jgi:hypothetical protein
MKTGKAQKYFASSVVTKQDSLFGILVENINGLLLTFDEKSHYRLTF